MKTSKRILAILLAVALAFSLALPAFAFPASDEGDGRDKTYGIAKGYVRTKESTKDSDGNAHVTATVYNKQGKPVKVTQTNKGDDYSYTSTEKYVCAYRYDDGSASKETTTYTYQKIGK